MEKKSLQTPFGLLKETSDGSLTITDESVGQDYHSSEGAWFEAHELNIVASGIRSSMDECDLAVLDVGLGLGYNAMATVDAWLDHKTPKSLNLVSLEINKDLALALKSGHAPWQVNWPDRLTSFCQSLEETEAHGFFELKASLQHPACESRLTWRVLIADGASLDLASLESRFDFFWQDPFTPDLNPRMWSPTWFKKLKEIAKPCATLMTYSAARVVKDGLSEGGWSVERIPTPGRKRHWLRARVQK